MHVSFVRKANHLLKASWTLKRGICFYGLKVFYASKLYICCREYTFELASSQQEAELARRISECGVEIQKTDNCIQSAAACCARFARHTKLGRKNVQSCQEDQRHLIYIHRLLAVPSDRSKFTISCSCLIDSSPCLQNGIVTSALGCQN